MHGSTDPEGAPSELRCRLPEFGWTGTSHDHEKGEKSTSETLQPCSDRTGPDTLVDPVGAEAGQAIFTPHATVSSKVTAGSSSVRESSPGNVASGNKEHDEPKGQNIDEVHPQEMFDAVVAATKAALNEAPR
uniref:Uncharacterized protein n=1 Tax=Peronospora matthiolae TaxID=2874970 RepID=A0AAV1ULN7_9STRA